MSRQIPSRRSPCPRWKSRRPVLCSPRRNRFSASTYWRRDRTPRSLSCMTRRPILSRCSPSPDGKADGEISGCPPEIGLLRPGVGGRVVLPEVSHLRRAVPARPDVAPLPDGKADGSAPRGPAEVRLRQPDVADPSRLRHREGTPFNRNRPPPGRNGQIRGHAVVDCPRLRSRWRRM